MLKVTELMVNDWVSINGSNFRVMEIKKKGVIKLYDIVLGMEHQIDFNTDYLEESLEPIPITTEILEKSGFEAGYLTVLDEHYLKGIDSRAGYVRLRFYKAGKIYLELSLFGTPKTTRTMQVRTEIRYVHELQHILYEAEIEQEIIV